MDMLNEGMIKFSSKDRNSIKEFFRGLIKVASSEIENPHSDHLGVVDKMNSYSSKWDGKIGKGGMQIGFIWLKNSSTAEFNHDDNIIQINIRPFSKVKAGKGGYKIQSIDFKTLAAAFYHELTHNYQDFNARSNSGLKISTAGEYEKTDLEYFTHPWEQQAWAILHVELLRNGLKELTPKEILAHLQNSGLIDNPRLDDLKKKKPSIWKKIMKNAIMYVVADLKKIRLPHHPKLP